MAVEQRLCDRPECGCGRRIVQVGDPPAPPRAVKVDVIDRVERYLRVTVEVPGGSIEAGLERKLGEPLYVLRAELRTVIAVCHAAVAARSEPCRMIDDDTAGPLTDLIERRLRATWPHRAWFVEVWSEAEALTQVYSPWGMPISAPRP